MVEAIISQVAQFNENERVNRLREALQIMILKILSDVNLLGNITFVGGTALRLLFNMQRFSEDLDFSLTNKEGYAFKHVLDSLDFQLKKYGFSFELKPGQEKTVQSVMIKFADILYQAKLSALKSQKISIKIEIDTNPPEGYVLAMSVVTGLYTVPLTHYDLPSLYASKLHACLYRKYTKGRDYYDLLWYIGKKIKPNFLLLNNAIKQTQGKDDNVNENNFADVLKTKLSGLDYNKIRQDVERFIVNKEELNIFTKETFLAIIK